MTGLARRGLTEDDYVEAIRVMPDLLSELKEEKRLIGIKALRLYQVLEAGDENYAHELLKADISELRRTLLEAEDRSEREKVLLKGR